MSFSFAAAGRKADVLAQLALVKGDALAVEVAELISRHVADATEHTYTDEHGTEKAFGYIVDASGHSWAGSQPSLNVTLKGAYFPMVPDPQTVGEGDDADSISGDATHGDSDPTVTLT